MLFGETLLASILRASLIAVVPFGLWIWGYFTSNKTWYFQASNTSIIFGLARFWYYVFPFLAIFFVSAGINDYYLGQDRHSGLIWLYVGIGSVAIGFICGFLQPNWLSPHWLRRLKREHGKLFQSFLKKALK